MQRPINQSTTIVKILVSQLPYWRDRIRSTSVTLVTVAALTWYNLPHFVGTKLAHGCWCPLWVWWLYYKCSSSRCWNPRSGRRVLCLTWLASFLYCWTASLVQIMLSKHMWPFADLLNKSTKCSGRVSLLSDSMVICQILPSLFDDGSTKQNFP